MSSWSSTTSEDDRTRSPDPSRRHDVETQKIGAFVTNGVVTLTFSPALDVATTVDVVAPSSKMRCAEPLREPGGGGINVARVARRLGSDVVAVAPLSGDRGQMVIDLLAVEGVVVEQIDTAHPVRQSFAVTETSTGQQYRFVLPAQPLTSADTTLCVNATCNLGIDAGCVVVSGSMSVPNVAKALRGIVEVLGPTPVLIDTSGAALEAALQSGAALVKPSARELADLVGSPLRTEDAITSAAVDTVTHARVGALLVSIGAGGAVLARPGQPTVRFRAPTVEVQSTIGAGDSLVAGVATGLARGDDLIPAIRLGIAAGTATVMTAGTELCDSAVVDGLLDFVSVDR